MTAVKPTCSYPYSLSFCCDASVTSFSVTSIFSLLTTQRISAQMVESGIHFACWVYFIKYLWILNQSEATHVPNPGFIVDYANKPTSEWISFALILFVCFSPLISVVSSPPKCVVCAWILCYLIKPSKHSGFLKPPLFFLSLIRDSIKKVNEVCGVLVFTIYFFATKCVLTTCLGFLNAHRFRVLRLSEWNHWQLKPIHIRCHLSDELMSHHNNNTIR